MLRFYNTKLSMLYNLLKVDEAWCFILDKLLDKTTVQGGSAAEDRVRFYSSKQMFRSSSFEYQEHGKTLLW